MPAGANGRDDLHEEKEEEDEAAATAAEARLACAKVARSQGKAQAHQMVREVPTEAVGRLHNCMTLLFLTLLTLCSDIGWRRTVCPRGIASVRSRMSCVAAAASAA